MPGWEEGLAAHAPRLLSGPRKQLVELQHFVASSHKWVERDGCCSAAGRHAGAALQLSQSFAHEHIDGPELPSPHADLALRIATTTPMRLQGPTWSEGAQGNTRSKRQWRARWQSFAASRHFPPGSAESAGSRPALPAPDSLPPFNVASMCVPHCPKMVIGTSQPTGG